MGKGIARIRRSVENEGEKRKFKRVFKVTELHLWKRKIAEKGRRMSYTLERDRTRKGRVEGRRK
jgi:hypothetical protein